MPPFAHGNTPICLGSVGNFHGLLCVFVLSWALAAVGFAGPRSMKTLADRLEERDCVLQRVAFGCFLSISGAWAAERWLRPCTSFVPPPRLRSALSGASWTHIQISNPAWPVGPPASMKSEYRSEEHTSELQSPCNLV